MGREGRRIRFALAFMLALACMVLWTTGAGALEKVKYIDADGKPKEANGVVELTKAVLEGDPYKNTLPSGWYLVSEDINTSNIDISGNVHLIIKDDCTLNVRDGSGSPNAELAAIQVPAEASLTIYAQSEGEDAGIIIARTQHNGSGIGGNEGATCGTITINGGKITADGSMGAGIGGNNSDNANVGSITINGGTIVAQSVLGAGIGGGLTCVNNPITINGGEITAESSAGAGIGCGSGASYGGGKITINGGNVIANSFGDSAGIGGWWGQQQGGEISINGGRVEASSTYRGAGIGGREAGVSGTIFIGSDVESVTATGGAAERDDSGGGAGIGSGGGSGGNAAGAVVSITIVDPSKVHATGGASYPDWADNGGENIGKGGQATYTLNVVAPTFSAVTVGYARPAAMPITISSKGSRAATIESVAVSPETAFEIGGGGGSVTSGGKIETWTVQPKAGLGASNYTAEITVTYNEGATAKATVTFNVYSPPSTDPRPAIGTDAVFTGTVSDGAAIEVPFVYAQEGMELELVLGGAVLPGAVGADGTARFEIPTGSLEPGTYPVSVRSPGGTPLSETPIGTLIIQYAPSVSGANQLTVLPGSGFEVEFTAVLTGADPKTPTALTLRAGSGSVTVRQTGDGAVAFALALDAAMEGIVPVTVSAPATATSEAIPETDVGAVTVINAAAYLSGDLAGKLGTGWLYGNAGANVPIAFEGDGAALSDETGILTAPRTGAMNIGINYAAPGKVFGTLTRVRVDPFAGSKAIHPVPAMSALKVEGAVAKAKQLAQFAFPAQDMNRLEPGDYVFAVEAQPSGKFQGFGPLTLALVRVTDGEAAPTAWTMPKTLRVSVGQQYQLIRPAAAGGELPPLKITGSKVKIATVTADGVLTAKKTGATTVKAKDPDGNALTCKLTVVANCFSRAKPLNVKGKPGLYTSTKKLSYSKGALVAEVFILNRTGKAIRGADEFVLELYDGETLIYREPLGPIAFKTALKHKKYTAIKRTITEEMLPGVSAKGLDLGSKRIQAVIRGVDLSGNQAQPLIAGMKGVAAVKGLDAQPNGAPDAASAD